MPWVRLLFEVLLCPKTSLERQTLAPKWREESKGQLHWSGQRGWPWPKGRRSQNYSFWRGVVSSVSCLLQALSGDNNVPWGPSPFYLRESEVLFFRAVYTSILMGAARLRIHVLWPLVHITRPVATQQPTFFMHYFRSSSSRKPSWMSAQGFKHIFDSGIQLCPYLSFE